jgi:hypothetical protein
MGGLSGQEEDADMGFFGKGGHGDELDAGVAANRFAMLAEVRAYWEGLRDGSDLPKRDAIDPRGIAGALENTFLIERVAPGIGRFRLAGMQLHDLMGMDVRGMPLSSLIEPAGRNRMAEALETVFAGPGTLEIWLEGERGIGRPALEARMLILPLTTPRGEIGLAIGCLAMHGALGRAPRRFAIASVMSEQIGRRTTDPRLDPRPDADRRLPETAASGLAEDTLAFAPAFPRPPRSKPNLRLVHSRD